MLFSLLLCLSLACGAGPAAAQAESLLLQAQGFEPGLPGWERQGAAEFTADAAQAREGRRSARLVVAPGAELHYQQLRRDTTRDILPGDEFRASVWVRTQGVTEDPGAYLALEFLDAVGGRAGIAHSRMGAGIGKSDWERLEANGTAPPGTKGIRLSLILHAHGTAWFADPEIARTGRLAPWPDLGGATRAITIRTREVVHPKFGGVGFHAFQHDFPASQEEMDQVIYKRWREMSPSFARLNDSPNWDRAKLDAVAGHIRRMKETGTEIYLTTWDPKETREGAERAAYAKTVVDRLEYLVRQKGLTNIRYYCMTNELSLNGWGRLAGDLPTFQSYHRALYEALKARNLAIGLLATDASPIEYWGTIEWAAQHMDDLTAVYGGHHYINDRAPDDERFYPWFLSKMAWGAGLARAKGKNFILGEFGSKQDGRTINGVLMDACVYWDTPQEPMVAIQLAEAVLAAMNGGVYAMGYWTFMDFPDDYNAHYKNKWGTFKCSGSDRSTRAPYYAYGLLTRFFRGPATVYRVETGDPRLRVAAVQHHAGGTWSVAVVNRNRRDVPVRLTLDGKPVSAVFRKYVYDPRHVPQNPFGDMPGPAGKARMQGGVLADTVGEGTLTVYTTAYDDRPPAPVRGLKVERTADGRDRVTWQAGAEPDLCYYRIYRSERRDFTPDLATQIGSTVGTSFTAPGGGRYRVLAVDRSGNVSR